MGVVPMAQFVGLIRSAHQLHGALGERARGATVRV
jgi:hypothetical protein